MAVQELLLTYNAANIATTGALVWKGIPSPQATITQFSILTPRGAATGGDYVFEVKKFDFGTETESTLTTVTIAENDREGYSASISEACVLGDCFDIYLTIPTGSTAVQPFLLFITYEKTFNADTATELAGGYDASDFQLALSGATLTAVTVAGNDKVLIQDTSDSNNLKTVTAQSVADLSPAETTSTIGTLISGATSKTTPVDADLLALSDSAASNILKKLTWANLKATLFAAVALITGQTEDTSPDAANDYVLTYDASATSLKKVKLANLPSSGGISDGDKGDITVSSSGTVWTVDNDAITYAKIQNISATSRILGRKTAGAGDTEEITLSELLDFIGSAAQGDILYRGAAGWARLGAGTSGQFLKTQGAAANPTWDTISGGGDLLSTNNLSDVANAATAATNLGLGTGNSPQFAGVNIGHASDTTLTRTGAGDIAVEGNGIYRAGGTDVPVADGGTGASDASGARTNLGLVIGTDVQAFHQNLADIATLADPNADRILFWDDSAGAYKLLTLGTNLSITGTTLDATGGGGSGLDLGKSYALAAGLTLQ